MRKLTLIITMIVLLAFANTLFAQRAATETRETQVQTARTEQRVQEQTSDAVETQTEPARQEQQPTQTPQPERRAVQNERNSQTPQQEQRTPQNERVTQPQTPSVRQEQRPVQSESTITQPLRPERQTLQQESALTPMRRERNLMTEDILFPLTPEEQSQDSISNSRDVVSQPIDVNHRGNLEDILRFRTVSLDHRQLSMLVSRVGLNAAQNRFVDSLIYEFQLEVSEQEELLKALLIEQGVAMINNDFNKSHRFAFQINAIRTEITVLSLQLYESIFGVLTPEQREQMTRNMFEAETGSLL